MKEIGVQEVGENIDGTQVIVGKDFGIKGGDLVSYAEWGKCWAVKKWGSERGVSWAQCSSLYVYTVFTSDHAIVIKLMIVFWKKKWVNSDVTIILVSAQSDHYKRRLLYIYIVYN